MRRVASAVWLAGALLAVAWATLAPAALSPPAPVRWLPPPADLLRNLLLFVPLGAAWAARGTRPGRVLAGTLALSVLLELAQLAIPGRTSSAWDALANTAGAGIGAGIARDAQRWLAPSPAVSRGLALAAGALASGWLVLGACLAAPSPPPGLYFAHWTPSLSNWFPIDASLREASLAGFSLPVGPLDVSEQLRQVLAGDFELRLAGNAGRPTEGLAALFWLTNDRGHEALLVGIERSDLILRWPGRGAALGLDAAPLRLPGFFEQPPGAPFELRIERRGPETRVTQGAAQSAGLGVTLGDGWRLLAPELRLARGVREGLAAAWLGALWLPIGFWFSRAAAPLVALAGAGAATLFAGRFEGLLPTPRWQLLAAALGFGFGALLQLARHARRADSQRV